MKQEIAHEKLEQDKVAMGYKDVEMRKFNREQRLKNKDKNLAKEADKQRDVITSTGANLDKFSGEGKK